MPDSLQKTLERKLVAALAPRRLEITDNSAKHAGHAGHRPGEQTHFSLTIASAKFAGLSRLERHRLVHTILAEELQNGIHALELRLET